MLRRLFPHTLKRSARRPTQRHLAAGTGKNLKKLKIKLKKIPKNFKIQFQLKTHETSRKNRNFFIFFKIFKIPVSLFRR